MIKVAIVGYGNLGRGVEEGIRQCPDMELVGVFTRRDPTTLKTQGSRVYPYKKLLEEQCAVDVCILCGGSATDLPNQTPELAARYNVVDTYDNHSLISHHFDAVDRIASQSHHSAIISSGWDPGLFSMMRLLGQAILPQGTGGTFWGRGVSQGHSDAIRRLEGVCDAVQYTIPNEAAIAALQRNDIQTYNLLAKHHRQCYVVLDEGFDETRVREQIVTMPGYFAPYKTEVIFVSLETLHKDHATMPHGGRVLHHAITGNHHAQNLEFKLNLSNNPEFTAAIVIAYARACARLYQRSQFGCFSVLDIAPKDLSSKTNAELRKELL